MYKKIIVVLMLTILAVVFNGCQQVKDTTENITQATTVLEATVQVTEQTTTQPVLETTTQPVLETTTEASSGAIAASTAIVGENSEAISRMKELNIPLEELQQAAENFKQNGSEELLATVDSIEGTGLDTKLVLNLYEQKKGPEATYYYEDLKKQATYKQVADYFYGSYLYNMEEPEAYHTYYINEFSEIVNQATPEEKQDRVYKVYVKDGVVELVMAYCIP